jgi:hypothetical protein
MGSTALIILGAINLEIDYIGILLIVIAVVFVFVTICGCVGAGFDSEPGRDIKISTKLVLFFLFFFGIALFFVILVLRLF